MFYIGVDLGTSAVKLLLMNEEGEVIKIISREYPLSIPHTGWSEQNPEDWYIQSISGIKELLSGYDSSLLRGLSVGGQMHGLVILDESDEVIRPAILWNDGRTQAETEYLNNEIGKQKLVNATANIAFAGFTAPKLLWLKNNEPENFAKIKKIMLPKDYLIYRLTGEFTTDYSDASGMLLLDVKNKCWSSDMLEVCNIREDMLPELYESYEPVGYIRSDVACEIGLKEKCMVAAGAGDNAAAAIGTGTVDAGGCNISVGTSGTIFVANDIFTVGNNNALHSFVHATGGYHIMGCMLSAAACNKWWTEDILNTKNYMEEQKHIDELGNNNVYFLPYLMGERSPHNDPYARGAFIGLGMENTRSDMTQAVFEGVAYGLRDSLEIIRQMDINVASSTICGGGAKSPLWRKIIANVMNMPISTLMVEEGPAYGAAMLAAVACGTYSDVKEAAKSIVRVKDTVYPDLLTVEKYNERYEVYKQLYPLLKNIHTGL
ncbi:MAG: xylulokinase [Coprococcus sp.]